MNFGVADAEYKRVFANRHIRDASLVLLRPGVVNTAKRQLHAAFQAVRTLARTFLNGRAPVREREDVLEHLPLGKTGFATWLVEAEPMLSVALSL